MPSQADLLESKLLAMRMLEKAGYLLIPLRGKQPCCKPGCLAPHKGCGDGWRKTKVGDWPVEVLAEDNYGVVLQADDLIIDVDPRNFKKDDEPVKRLVADINMPLNKAFAVRTGGGGFHVYLKKPAGISVRNSLKAYPGIEFKSLGQQVVGPGSVHPVSGKLYEIHRGSPSTDVTFAFDSLLDLIKRAPLSEDYKTDGTGVYMDDAATQGRFLEYLENSAPTSGSFIVACHGRDMGLPPQRTLELMMEAWNKRRNTARTESEMKSRVLHAYKYAKGAVGSAHPSVGFEAVVVPPTLAPEGAAVSPSGDKALAVQLPWELTPQGGVRKSFLNLLNYFNSPGSGLHKIIAFNEFTGRFEFTAPAPWHENGVVPRYPGVGDADIKMMKGFLATRHKFETSVQNIEEAVTNVAIGNKFHPVRDYLTSLVWDGKPRLDTWLHDYLGAPNDGYTRAVARKTLCGAVMRVIVPGIKFDHVLVLEGAQDIGKSSVIEILGGEWAADAAVDPHSRDTVDMMQGRWIIELAEMEVVRRTDAQALKAFLTRKVDLARLAFGRATKAFPRQSIFIATTNDATYHKDETGGRRWWPVHCDPQHGLGQVDFSGLAAARDMLFAEAVARVKGDNKEKLFMETSELKAEAKKLVELRRPEHPWVERVAQWLADTDKTPETRKEFLTSRDVFIDAMGGTDMKLDRRATLDVSIVMKALGWKPGFKWDGRSLRGYVRPVDESSLAGL